MHKTGSQSPKLHLQGGQILNFNVGQNLDLRIPRVSNKCCTLNASRPKIDPFTT